MRILIGCEMSGVVREAFRAAGHDAWSCDIVPTEIPGPHIINDVRNVLDYGWELAIFHPPCQYLSNAGIGLYNVQKYGQKAVDRKIKRQDAMQFFLALWDAPIPMICIENPIGYMNTHWRKPDQIIQPYYWGDPDLKTTCLWLKGLPGLMYGLEGELWNTSTSRPAPALVQRRRATGRLKNRYFTDAKFIVNSDKTTAARERSRTFPAIAQAMADQWSNI